MGVSRWMRPLYMVDTQLKILIAVGMAIKNVMALKMVPASTDWPLTNMWWPQTKKPKKAMAKLLMAMNWSPNSRLRENTGMISLTTPNAGTIMMYTAGCE